jgi:hypothetical protein
MNLLLFNTNEEKHKTDKLSGNDCPLWNELWTLHRSSS